MNRLKRQKIKHIAWCLRKLWKTADRQFKRNVMQ